MPQILEARLQKFVNQELPDVHLDLEKAEEPEIMLPSMDHRQSNGIPEEHLLLLYWLHESLWLCVSQQIVENS